MDLEYILLSFIASVEQRQQYHPENRKVSNKRKNNNWEYIPLSFEKFMNDLEKVLVDIRENAKSNLWGAPLEITSEFTNEFNENTW